MAATLNKRQYMRRSLNIRVRYAVRTLPETSGRIINISEGGFFIAPSTNAKVGDIVIAYADGLGRLKGRVVRTDRRGFAVALDVSEKQKRYLATRIAALLNGVPYMRILDRRVNRRLDLDLEVTSQILPNGPFFDCVVVEMDADTLVVRTDQQKPAIGAPLRIGGLVGRVASRRRNGFVFNISRLARGARNRPGLLERIWLNSTHDCGQDRPKASNLMSRL